MKKRLLSLFLALTLLVSLAPAALAVGSSGFDDVSESDWFYTPVQWAVKNGITSGLTATTFGPNNPCTRAQVVTFLWAAAGKPNPIMVYNPFSDVSTSDYYYKAVIWAVQEGITGGTSRTTFSPEDSCTRSQVVTFLWAAAGKPTPEASVTNFTDVADSDWFCTPVLWAVENSITSGLSETLFGSDNTCTRGQIVTFLYAANKAANSPDKELMEQFEAKTIHDFPEHLVINFDSDSETNFGVLNEDVIRWENKSVTAEKLYDGELTKYVFSDEAMLKDVPLGSVIYVLSAKGTPYLVSVGSVDGNVVTTDPDTPMSAYYTYLDAHFSTEIDTEAMERAGTNDNSNAGADSDGLDSGWNNKLGITYANSHGIVFGGKLNSESYELGLTGSASCFSDGDIQYDFELFGEDYVDFWMESRSMYTVEATGKIKAEAKLHSLNEELEVGELPLYTIVPGLDLTLELKLPVNLEAEAEFTADLTIAKVNRVEYKNTYDAPIHTTYEEEYEPNIDASGKVELKAGAAVEVGVDFLDDKLELVLELKVMGGIRGTVETPGHSIKDDPDSVHMCDACLKGEVFAEITGEIKFQVNISKKTKLELVSITLAKIDISLKAFYVSLANPVDSLFGSETKFGIGSCPNHMYRVKWKLVDINGKPVTTDYTVRYSPYGGSICTTNSDKYTYLYDGDYGAAAVIEHESGNDEVFEATSFVIKGFPEEISLLAPADNERDIYTQYLLNGGYKTIFKNGKAKNAVIYTNYGDFDGNGVKDLLLSYADTTTGGVRGWETYTVLYTIDKNSGEVVEVYRCSNPGGSGGGDDLNLYHCTITDSPKLAIYSVARAGAYGGAFGYFVRNYAEQSVTEGDSFSVDYYSLSMDPNWLQEEIDAAKKGLHTIKNDTLYVYHINDKVVSESTYNNALYLEEYPKDSEFATYEGTYNEPIRPDP